MEQRRGLGPGNVFVLISTFCLNSAETLTLLMRDAHMLDKSIPFLGALTVSFGLAQIYVGYDPEPFGTQTSKWGKCGQGSEQLRLLWSAFQSSGPSAAEPRRARRPTGPFAAARLVCGDTLILLHTRVI